MRLSDADRELLFANLARHAGEGRLDVDELEQRIAAIAEARTHEQAAAVMADLPPLTSDAGQAPRARRGRGHGDADAPEPGWAPTEERFRDPRSGRVMRVWADAAGGRHYLAEP
ncbi:MAG: DUF1707 SHOCT-like domain-containing protein [Solirubrobacteraceae bacterium]